MLRTCLCRENAPSKEGRKEGFFESQSEGLFRTIVSMTMKHSAIQKGIKSHLISCCSYHLISYLTHTHTHTVLCRLCPLQMAPSPLCIILPCFAVRQVAEASARIIVPSVKNSRGTVGQFACYQRNALSSGITQQAVFVCIHSFMSYQMGFGSHALFTWFYFINQGSIHNPKCK